jgi:hypothetical protein
MIWLRKNKQAGHGTQLVFVNNLMDKIVDEIGDFVRKIAD